MKIVQSEKPPCAGAVDQGDGTWLVTTDDAKLEAGAVELKDTAARDAAPKRYDLPKNHPLYGMRALRNVPAGSTDIVVTESGELASEVTAIAEPIGELEIPR